MQVEQVMSHQVKSCRASDTLATAARMMWDHDIGAVPVVGDGGRPVGVVTDRDICMAACFSNLPLSAMPVGEHMSGQVFSVEPGASVEAAEQLMAEKQVRRLPVVGFEGELVGMITMSDLARAAVESHRQEVDVRKVAATISRIVKARRPELATA
jgi:CBS-domain-containing membrane protein